SSTWSQPHGRKGDGAIDSGEIGEGIETLHVGRLVAQYVAGQLDPGVRLEAAGAHTHADADTRSGEPSAFQHLVQRDGTNETQGTADPEARDALYREPDPFGPLQVGRLRTRLAVAPRERGQQLSPRDPTHQALCFEKLHLGPQHEPPDGRSACEELAEPSGGVT